MSLKEQGMYDLSDLLRLQKPKDLHEICPQINIRMANQIMEYADADKKALIREGKHAWGN